jgi:hypothetical protein
MSDFYNNDIEAFMHVSIMLGLNLAEAEPDEDVYYKMDAADIANILRECDVQQPVIDFMKTYEEVMPEDWSLNSSEAGYWLS